MFIKHVILITVFAAVAQQVSPKPSLFGNLVSGINSGITSTINNIATGASDVLSRQFDITRNALNFTSTFISAGFSAATQARARTASNLINQISSASKSYASATSALDRAREQIANDSISIASDLLENAKNISEAAIQVNLDALNIILNTTTDAIKSSVNATEQIMEAKKKAIQTFMNSTLPAFSDMIAAQTAMGFKDVVNWVNGTANILRTMIGDAAAISVAGLQNQLSLNYDTFQHQVDVITSILNYTRNTIEQ